MRKIFPLILVFILATGWHGARAQENKENSDFKLAVNLYNDGMYDLAAEQFKNFFAAYPTTSNGIEARFYLGLTQMKLKRYEDARMTFQNFALAYVDHQKAPEAWMKVAEAFLALNNEHEAASAYERIKVFHPKSPLVPDALLNAARIYLRLGEKENAGRIFRSIVEDYPASKSAPSARLTLAEFEAEEGQPALAEQEARRVSESDAPESIRAEALYFVGTLKTTESLFDEAETTFRGVIAQYPGTPGAIMGSIALGNLLRSSGKSAEAVHLFGLALSLNPVDSLKAHALLEIGLAYLQAKTYDSARIYFDRTVATDATPEIHQRALLEAGNTAYVQKDYKGAEQYFNRIVSAPSSPLYRKALIRLAETYVADRRYEDGAHCYESYLDRYPEDPFSARVAFSLGTLYEKQTQDYKKAIDVLNRAIDKFPQSSYAAACLVEIGHSQESMGRYDEAVQSYNDVLTRYPALDHNEELRQRIEFLEHHRVRNRDVGMEKLSRLVGEMLIQTSKASLAFQLGQVYFYDLKDYQSAAQQFTFAIDNGIDKERFVEAYFLRARSYDLLGEIDSSAVDEAIMYYDSFRKQYLVDTLSHYAAYYSFLLKSKKKSATEVLLQARELLTEPLRPDYRAALLLKIGELSLSESRKAEGLQYLAQLQLEDKGSPVWQKGLMALGSWYAGHSAPDSAVIFWKRAVADAPNGRYTAVILELLGRLQTHRQNYAEAIDAYTHLINAFPYTGEAEEARRGLAEVCLASGQYDRAIAELEASLKAAETSPFTSDYPWDITLQLAKAYERKGLGQKAIFLYNQYLLHNRTAKNAGETYYALGNLARNVGHTDAATYYFKQAATLGSGGAASQEIAELLFESQEYAEAARQYSQLAQADTSATRKQQFLMKVIVATLRMDKLPEGQKLLNEFEKTYGERKECRAEFDYEKAMSYYRKQENEKAMKAFEHVADDYEETAFGPRARYYIGKILEVTNRLGEAAKQYDDVLKQSPAADIIPRVLLSLGNIHYNAERYEEAIRFYQRIIDEADKAGDILPYAMNNLIEAYESTKLYDAALKMTREFIEKYPNDESITDKKIKIGTLYSKLGYYEQAITHFQNLLNESGSQLEAELHYNIGEAYYSKGDYRQAILEFLKVPYLVSRQGKVNWTATALYMAGQSYEKMSRFDEAIGMYQQIVDRSGIDATFKAAARKEIDRVKSIVKKDLK